MNDLLATKASMTWLTPSKKKNLLTTKVLMSMTKEAAMAERRHMMLIARMMLRAMYALPARFFLNKRIVIRRKRFVGVRKVEA